MTDQNIQLTKLLDIVREVHEKKLPFNRVLGLKIDSLTTDKVCVKFDMKQELIGNFVYGILHGGVISSVLDATGGIAATVSALKRMDDFETDEAAKRISKIGTIDLRVDYLRPGKGNYFLATASIMRTGRKVAVTRMELHNDRGSLIAVGTGTYLVG
ncbi:MAG: thioesterase family protein [Desulfobacteraceae bacterium]|nr:thioesterase family protein [Desulfobacteraceae bacterium]